MGEYQRQNLSSKALKIGERYLEKETLPITGTIYYNWDYFMIVWGHFSKGEAFF